MKTYIRTMFSLDAQTLQRIKDIRTHSINSLNKSKIVRMAIEDLWNKVQIEKLNKK